MNEEFFHCTQYDIKLTRTGCAKRHVRSKRRAYPGEGHSEKYTTCKSCEIGKQHAEGGIPDVPVVALIQRARAA